MPSSYTYRLLKGASWGIVITLRGEILTGVELPPNALKITEAMRLQIDVGWHPSEEEIEFLKRGLSLVASNVEKTCPGETPILVRLTGLDYNPTDYQPEGLAAAVTEWTAQLCRFPKPEIPVTFNRALRRYVFDFPYTEMDATIIALGAGIRIVITAPPNTWVAESVLAVLRHFWRNALFQPVGSSDRKPIRDVQVVIRGSTFHDFYIILLDGVSGVAEESPSASTRKRLLRFLVNESPSSAAGLQQVTLVCIERTEDVEQLRLSLEKSLWANEVGTQGMSQFA